MDTIAGYSGNEVAIIGMAGRFPGAQDLAAFWQNIQSGVESLTSLSDKELLAAGVDPALLRHPTYVKAAIVLDDIALFDASFFGITAREAEIMDPQQRLFLECAWEALENAGYDSQSYEKWIGVYGGANSSGYFHFNLASHPDLFQKRGMLQVLLGNEKDFLTTRVSYKLNLNGPSIAVQTACSTSLVALHLACQSLQAGECSMALVGGVSITVPHKQGYLYQEGDIASPDGHCRSFDAQAQGSVRGSGLGIVVLKLLTEALTDGDTIHAVIKGSAINNDGALKVSFTAPSVNRQSQVISEAIAEAAIDPTTITYIEAHGSGTPLGDTIEIAALTRAFRKDTVARGFCALGSVKTNIGHLDAAAGIAGLIKTVLALQNKMIPPSLHFEQPNPNIDFENSPFYVNTELTPWTGGELPRRAGVSSFGMGGTNAHVILEEAPLIESSGSSHPWQLLLLSARTASALESATDKLVAYLKQHPEQNLADIAYTYQVGRRAFLHRRMLVCQQLPDALQALETRDTRRVLTHTQQVSVPPIAFLFPGVGDHYVSMAQEWYESEAVFRQHVDTCCEILQRYQDLDLRAVLYPGKEQAASHQQAVSAKPFKKSIDLRAMLNAGQRNTELSMQRLHQTAISQPALFVIEYALAQLLMSWGIQPQAMLGYSLGEYVAACLAGVFSLEAALQIVVKRAQLIQTLPECRMLAIAQAAQTIEPLLHENVFLSAINGPKQCIVSGTVEHIVELEKQLMDKGIVYRRLQTSHAFHSPMLEPISEAFAALFKTVKLNPPAIPLISNVTGRWMTAEEALDPRYWAAHLCQTVRFADGVHELLREAGGILLEVGPGQALCSLVMQDVDVYGQNTVALPLLRPHYDQRSDREFLLNALGKLWMMGVPLDWSGYHAAEQRRRIPLPTYPFERQRYWIAEKKHRYAAERAEPSAMSNSDEIALNAELSWHPRSSLLHDYIAPRNEIERKLASVWQDVLGIDQVGVHDNFFELGGSSLSSIQLVNRLRQVFQVPIPLDYPFKAPLLEDLATVIEKMLLEKLAVPAVIPRRQQSSSAQLSFAQQHIWNFERSHPGTAVYNFSFGYYGLHGPLNVGAFAQSLHEVVNCHEILRTTFVESEGQVMQIIAPSFTLPLTIVDLKDLPAHLQVSEVEKVAHEVMLCPFDLARGPLLRVKLLRLSVTEHVLILNAHHMIYDGWSQGVLFRQLSTLYPAFVSGTPPSSSELPVQYADFAIWQRQWLQGSVLQAQLDYWKQQLKDAPPALNLPTDYERSTVRHYRSKHCTMQLPQPLVDRLRAFCQQEDMKLFIVVFAAFNILHYHLSQQEDILVGTGVSNRNRAEIEKLIGCFVNTLVIRTHVSDTVSCREYLRQVRQVILEAYAHQVLPFEKLIEELQPLPSPSGTPLIQTMLVMHDVPLPQLALSDITARILDSSIETMLYDLMLVVVDLDMVEGLQVILRYQCYLYSEATVMWLLAQWQSILHGIIADPDQAIMDLPMEPLPAQIVCNKYL